MRATAPAIGCIALAWTLAGCGGGRADSSRAHAGGGERGDRGSTRDRRVEAPAAPRATAIVWVRRPPVGSEWREVVSRELSRTETTIERDGQEHAETTRRAFDFDASAVVVVAEPRREVVRYTVARFTRADATRSADVVRAGTVLDVARELGRGWVTRSGRAIEARTLADVAEVLEIGLAPPDDDRDTLFGSRAPRMPGDSWAADVRVVARLLGQPMDRVRATVTLRERRAVDGVPCSVLTYDVAVAERVVADVPSEHELESASLRMQGEIALPLDTRLPALRSTTVVREEQIFVGRTNGRRRAVTSERRTTELRTMRSAIGVHERGPAR